MMNRIAGVLLWVFLICAAFSDAYGGEKAELSSPHEEIRNEIVKWVGIPYLRGGSSKRGVDCSGFVRLIYKAVFGLDLPHKARYQSSLPLFSKVSESGLRTGDLIFFSPTVRKRGINHVGIYLSDGRFAHAVRKKGVTISSLREAHWRSRIMSFKRFVNPGRNAGSESL